MRHLATIERYMYAEPGAGRRSAYRGFGRELAEGSDAVVAWFDRLGVQAVRSLLGGRTRT